MLPERPDKAIGLFETGGGRVEAGFALNAPSVQLRLRGEAHGYAAARERCKLAMQALHGREDEVGAGTVLCQAVSPPIALGADAEERPILVVNFRLLRSE